MEKQLTIIVPTYNMEKYIHSCIDSLLIPELDLLEVLIVNDGSTDSSLDIAKEYEKKYPQSIRVINKPNGNYGSCINAALPLANGKYIKILDADDTFDSDELVKFVDLLPDIDDDAIITSFVKVNEAGVLVRNVDLSVYNVDCGKTYQREEAFASSLKNYTPMHRIAYKRDVFRSISYHQTEGISYTDIEWATVPMSMCKTFRFLDLKLYRYLVGREGQTVDPVRLRKSLGNLFIVASSLINNWKFIQDKSAKQYIFSHTLDFHKLFYTEILNIGTQEAMGLVRSYEEKMRIESPEFYKAIGEITYDRNSKFRIFNDIRKKDYPSNYTIPYWERIKLSCRIRFKKVFG